MVARIKKNDTVVVLSGKDKGKKGTVLEVLPKKDLVMVKDVAIVTRHLKARKQNDVPGIKKQEGYLSISRVMPICGSCKKPCRVNTKMIEGNKRVRACNRCEEIF
jgi:large subunit ribosomal protein L24